MAYRFKRKESVPEAVCRLCSERIGDAIDCLRDADKAKAIHGARKDIKKTRAVLRLVRGHLGKGEFRRLTAQLHAAAADLAGPRDAQVKVQALRKLTAHFKGQLAPGSLRRLRHALRDGEAEALLRFIRKKRARASGRQLRRIRKAVARLKVRGEGWTIVGAGVRNIYREGRHAQRAAADAPSPETLHTWRKRVKDLWYHVRLLAPVWPEQMEAMAHELDQLGELLGDDHDLVVLRQDIEARSGVPEAELTTVRALIDERRRELHANAFALGTRFYAEKPSDFGARLARYWHAWRREKVRLPRNSNC